MRKLVSFVLCLGLAAALCVNSLAAGSAEIVRAFVYEGTLYTYISMDGMEKPITKAEVKVGGQTLSATGRLETVRQAGAPVTWLLLVDNSTSMPEFRQETEGFAQALAQTGGENTRFILATFGDAFAVVSEDVPAEELAEQVEAPPSTSGSPGFTPPLIRRWTTSRGCPGSGTSCGVWSFCPTQCSTIPRAACPMRSCWSG